MVTEAGMRSANGWVLLSAIDVPPVGAGAGSVKVAMIGPLRIRRSSLSVRDKALVEAASTMMCALYSSPRRLAVIKLQPAAAPRMLTLLAV